jgi:hypothetical protein
MAAPDAVLLALFALLVGVAVGFWLRGRTLEAPPEPPPPPPARPRPTPLEERYAPHAAELTARVMPDAPPTEREAVSDAVASMLADAWSEGVSELRENLVEHSGLPRDLMDSAASSALDAIERSRR